MPEPAHERIQAAIAERGYHWQAGPTPVSHLSVDEQAARLGLLVEDVALEATAEAVRAANEAAAARPIEAPPGIDWRAKAGDWVTSVKDQGACGACVAFAILATLEARLNIACANAALDEDLSEAQLFFSGCGECCDTGWDFAPALAFARDNGIGEEASFPYTPRNQPGRSIRPYVKLDGWREVLAAAERKSVLAERGPLVGGFKVFADFFAYREGVYRQTSDDFRGYHAVSVIGYDDAQRCWICKNSWGPEWGDSGFFRIGYGECLIDTSFAAYDLDVTCPSS
jgi:C1A family cysteine protease